MNPNDALKKRRREAYRKAKALRDQDPAYQALKEQARQERKLAIAHFATSSACSKKLRLWRSLSLLKSLKKSSAKIKHRPLKRS